MKYLIILIVFFLPLGKSPEYYFQEGNKYFDKKEYKKAIDMYSKAIKIKPEYIDAYWKRGISKIQIDSNNSAINDFTRIIEIYPTGDAYNERGKARYNAKDTTGACEDWFLGCELMNNRSCDLQRINCR